MEMTDLEARTELSKVLGAPDVSLHYGYTKSDMKVYSWAEVFSQIGRLQERASQHENITYGRPEMDVDSIS